MMYKRFYYKKCSLAFNVFPATAKQVSKVYLTGIRNWVANDSFNYSIVLGIFRIIFSINREIADCCCGEPK